MKHITLRTAFHWTLLTGIFICINITCYKIWKQFQVQGTIEKFLNITDKTVIIFTATPYFGAPFGNSSLKKCSDEVKKSCIITNNKDHFSNANAVLFHSRDIDERALTQLKLKRRFDIPYVMMTMESPFYASLTEYSNYFNWTMTYRKDSDVLYPYGALIKNKEPAKINFTEIWNSKKKETLWLVSNNKYTKNKRKKLVEKLVENGMNIDLFGKVFENEPKECPRRGGPEGCEEKFHSPYKFTIAFENNNCKDYVTEKFWRKAGRYKMVPIVMSRKIYKNLGIPDSMYISIDDFPTLRDFVGYIKKVSSNETEYVKYHKWREDFRIVDTNEENYGFCQLCQKLMDLREKPEESKTYESLATWYSTTDCDNSFANRYL